MERKVKEVEEGRIIELKNDGMCPFLNEKKLCKIVLDGEGAISETCHTFPRKEHEYIGRVERALTPGCPGCTGFVMEAGVFSDSEEQMEGIAEEIYEINPVLFEIRDGFSMFADGKLN